MKKLLMTAAIVCATVMAQAATVNWSISNVKNSLGAAPTAGWAVMAFYTEVGAGSSAIENAIKAGTAASSAIESKTLSVALGSGRIGAHDATAASITDTSKNYDFYFVVFNNADASKATEYAMASALNVEYSSMAGKFSASGNFKDATWQTAAIPEPTSGLLMLLGVAGLALRRRRA